MHNGIYLDNSTITRPTNRAISKMMPYLTDFWGTPTAPHRIGQTVLPAMEEAYQAIYALLDAKEHDTLVFTSSGAEAVNQAIFSTYEEVTRRTGKNQFLTSTIDEAPALMAIGRLEHLGCISKMVPASPQGSIQVQHVAETISPRTAMISLSWANGLTGVIHPIAEIASLCKERGIVLHVDATHVLGKLFFQLDEVGADLITFNGSHLHAPQGTGGIYAKSGRSLPPFIVGGLEQGGHRAGDINVAGLVSLGEAAKETLENRDLMCTEIARLRNQLETGIVKGFPEAIIFFKEQERVPHITAIGFPGIANEALLFALNRKGVFANIGGGNFQKISLILSACGIPETLANTAISFSLSWETLEEEIDRAIEVITETAHQLRKLSLQLLPQHSKGI